MESIVHNIHQNLSKKRQHMTSFMECLTKMNEYLFKTKEYIMKVDGVYNEIERHDKMIYESINELFSSMGTHNHAKIETNNGFLNAVNDCSKTISINNVSYDRMSAEFEKDYNDALEEEKLKRRQSKERNSSEYRSNDYKNKRKDDQRSHSKEDYKPDVKNRHKERFHIDRKKFKPYINLKCNRPPSPPPCNQNYSSRNVKNDHCHEKYHRVKSNLQVARLRSHDSEEEYKTAASDFRVRNVKDEFKNNPICSERLKSRDSEQDKIIRSKNVHDEDDKRMIKKETERRLESCERAKKIRMSANQIREESNPKRRKLDKIKKKDITAKVDSNVEIRCDNIGPGLKDAANMKECNMLKKSSFLQNLPERDETLDNVTLNKNDEVEEKKTDNDKCPITNLEDIENKEAILKTEPVNEIEEGEISELSSTSTSSSSSSSDTNSDKSFDETKVENENKSNTLTIASDVVIKETMNEDKDHKDEIAAQVFEEFDNVVGIEVEAVSQAHNSKTIDEKSAIFNEEILNTNKQTVAVDQSTPSKVNLEIDSDINTSVCSNASLKQSTTNPNVMNITLSRRRRKIVKLE